MNHPLKHTCSRAMWSSHFFGMWLSYKIFILLSREDSARDMRMAIKLSQRSKVFYFLCYFWFSCFKIHSKKNRRAGVRHTTHRNRIIVKMAETVLSNLHCIWSLLTAPSRKGLISENKTLAVSNAGSLTQHEQRLQILSPWLSRITGSVQSVHNWMKAKNI